MKRVERMCQLFEKTGKHCFSALLLLVLVIEVEVDCTGCRIGRCFQKMVYDSGPVIRLVEEVITSEMISLRQLKLAKNIESDTNSWTYEQVIRVTVDPILYFR